MISIERRREVFRRYFLYLETQKKICSDLSLSKGSVTKIVKQCRQRILELDLTNEDDLESYIDKIVIDIKRKKREYKRIVVTDIHIAIAKSLVISNEKNKAIKGKSAGKSMDSLFEDFDIEFGIYFEGAYRMKKHIDKMNNEAYITEGITKEYDENYRIFEGICRKHDIPFDLENLDRNLYDLSIHTFYKLVKDIKREMKNELKKQMEARENNSGGLILEETIEDEDPTTKALIELGIIKR